MALPMKKVMKAKKVNNVARGRGTKSRVFTARDKLVRKKRGKVVSKVSSAAHGKNFGSSPLKAWSPVAAAVPKLDSDRASDIGATSWSDVESQLEHQSEVAMVDTATKEFDTELEKKRRYAMAGPLGRALPECYFALLVTLLVEVRVSFISSLFSWLAGLRCMPCNELEGMLPVAAAAPKLDSGRAFDTWTISGSEVESKLEHRTEVAMVDTGSQELEAELEKNRRYTMAGPLRRAVPERYIALLVTLLVEVPVALIISGGSEDLRITVGSQRYELLMAFLPLNSAISGNVGLQASTLTTRAISHGDCHRGNFRSWLCTELYTSFILGALMGLALSALSLAWTSASLQTGVDVGFSLTVGFSQALSIGVAGLTGTCAPVLFSFVCRRDAGKWAGPLETAVQDIVGSFAMVYVGQAMLMSFIRWGLSAPGSTVPRL